MGIVLFHLFAGNTKADSTISASGSGVERRLAKAKVAGSNPVSRSFYLLRKSVRWQASGVFLYYDY